MKCQVTSNKTHDVLISKDIGYRSYKDICSGEKTKVNLGYNNDPPLMTVKDNTLISTPPQSFINGKNSWMSEVWEILSIFFSHHNIEPNWVNCHFSRGWFDEQNREWTALAVLESLGKLNIKC